MWMNWLLGWFIVNYCQLRGVLLLFVEVELEVCFPRRRCQFAKLRGIAGLRGVFVDWKGNATASTALLA